MRLNIVKIRPLALQRFVYGRDPKQSGIPMLFLYIQGYRIQKRAMAQGYGRHNKEEGLHLILYHSQIIKYFMLYLLYFSLFDR